MKFTSCPICAYPHNPATQCPPGRRRRYEIDFPLWAKSTPCELRTRGRSFRTAHGIVKFQTYELTPHGQYLAAMRRPR